MHSLSLVLLAAIPSILCYEAKGPPRADKGELKHIAKVGDEVKLICPVHGHPAPMVTWSRDGEVINFAWNRFRVNKRQMKIKGVIKEDTGVYLCKAINGFGSVEIKVELIVIRPEEMTGVNAGDINKLSSPRFSPASLESQKSLVRSAGSELVLHCSVSGYPAPTIQWYKDDQLYQTSGSKLTIRSLQTRDSGAFSCVAQNMIGTSALTFTLNVRPGGRLPSPSPNMIGHANISVEQGDTARLDCRVTTNTKPNIKWLKKLESSGDWRDSEVINVGSEHYRLIEASSQVVSTSHGDFLSQLVLEKADREDEGMYICFVTSFNGGFNFKPSYLTVVQKSDTGPAGPMDFTLLILIIIISIVTTLLIIGTVACLVQKRQKSPPSSPETVTVEVSPEKPIFKRERSGGYETPSFGLTSSRLEDLLTQSTPLNSPDTSQDQQYFVTHPAYLDFNDHFNTFNEPYSQHNIYEVPSLQRHPHQHQPHQHFPGYGYYETARLNNSFNSSYSSRR